MIADKISDDRKINEILALRIANYWAQHGYAISTLIERVKVGDQVISEGNNPIYAVRSDMRDGWPAGRRS